MMFVARLREASFLEQLLIATFFFKLVANFHVLTATFSWKQGGRYKN